MILRRKISYSVYITWRQYSTMREARYFDKLIRKAESKSKKKKSLTKSTSINDYAKRILNSPVPKRLNVLNKVFMDHVSDLTSTGEYSEELSRLGIQVVKAKISPNLHVLFLYWIHTKPIVNEEEVLDLLPKIAGNIRYELTTVKVMGQVPEVRFVKHEKLIEMELIKKILEDFSYVREAEEKELKKHENEELEESEDHPVKTHDSLKTDVVMSKLKQNIYGLDYPKVLENILKQKMKRQPDNWERGTTPRIVLSKNSEKLQFDKNMLEKVIFKETYEIRKQQQLYKQLMSSIDYDQNLLLENEEDEENYCFDEDNVVYDDSLVDEEVKKILDGHTQDELTDTKTK